MAEETKENIEEEIKEEPEAEGTPETEEKSQEEPEEGKAKEDAEETAEEAVGTPEDAAEEASEEPSGEAESSEEAAGRRFWQKKQKKDKKDEKIDDLTDKLTRQMAEFDNFRKRTEKEKALSYGLGARDVIEKLLPVVDNFERGLENADMEDPFTQGMEKTYKQMVTILEGLGVTPIEALGKEFDPNLHNAVMHVEDETVGENIVVEEFQKGYMYHDMIVRHSMVKVAN